MFAVGLLLGVAAGVAIGMLYAPGPGRQTRQIMTERAREMGERAREMGERAREMGQVVREQAERIGRTVRREGEETTGA